MDGKSLARRSLLFAAVVILTGVPYVLGMQHVALRPYLVPASVAIATLTIVWLNYRSAEEKRLHVFGKRAPIAAAHVFETQFATSGIDRGRFLEVWARCARALHVSEQLVRSTDRLAGELAPSNALDAIGHPIENLFDLALRGRSRDKRLRAELRSISTFGEFVCWLARQPDPPPSWWERVVSRVSRLMT